MKKRKRTLFPRQRCPFHRSDDGGDDQAELDQITDDVFIEVERKRTQRQKRKAEKALGYLKDMIGDYSKNQEISKVAAADLISQLTQHISLLGTMPDLKDAIETWNMPSTP